MKFSLLKYFYYFLIKFNLKFYVKINTSKKIVCYKYVIKTLGGNYYGKIN